MLEHLMRRLLWFVIALCATLSMNLQTAFPQTTRRQMPRPVPRGRAGTPTRGRAVAVESWRRLRPVYTAGEIKPAPVDLTTIDVPPIMEAPTKYLDEHKGAVGAVRFSPDGKTLASGGMDMIVCLWDLSTGKVSRRFTVDHAIYCLAFSRDGKKLAVGEVGGEIRVFDVATGKSLASMHLVVTTIHNLVFLPNGRELISTDCNGEVNVWSASTGENIRSIDAHHSCVHGAALNQAGTLLATASEDGSAKVIDVATGAITANIPGIDDHVYSVLWSKNDDQVFVFTTKYMVFGYDLAHHTRTFKRPLSASFSWRSSETPDHATALISLLGEIHVLSGADARPLAILRGTGYNLQALDISPDGKWVAGAASWMPLVFSQNPGSFNPRIALWNLSDLPDPSKVVRTTAFAASADGQIAALGRQNGSLSLVDPSTGRPLAELKGHTGTIVAAAFNPAGSQLVTADRGEDNTLRLWDVAAGKQSRLLNLKGEARGVAWVQGGRVAFTDGNDLLLWSPDQDAPRVLASGAAAVRAIAASPDGRYLLATRVGGAADLFDLSTDAPPRPLQRPEIDEIDALAMLPDNRHLCTQDRRYGLVTWDLQTLEPVQSRDNPGYHVLLAPLADASQLLHIFRGSEHRLSVLDIASGHPVTPIPTAGYVIGLKYLAASDELITATIDGTVRKSVLGLSHKLNITTSEQLVSILPEKNLLAAVQGKSLSVVDFSTSAVKMNAQLDADKPAGVAFSPDGTTIAVGELNECLLVDTASGQVSHRFSGPPGAFHYLAFSPDGTRLASVHGALTPSSSDQFPCVAYIWNVQTGAEVCRLAAQPSRIGGIHWSPDGKRVLTYTAPPRPFIDQQSLYWPAAVWDAASGERLHTFGQVDKPLTTALFSPDGKSILTANLTGGIYRFDAASYQLQDILPAGSAGFWNITFSPDGKTFLVMRAAGAMSLYDSATLRATAEWPSQTEFAQDAYPTFIGRRPAILWFDRNTPYTKMLPPGGAQ
jgi:WD40 repeat protein